jgi:hypothetical protein
MFYDILKGMSGARRSGPVGDSSTLEQRTLTPLIMVRPSHESFPYRLIFLVLAIIGIATARRAPHSFANAASERMRSGLSPARISISAAVPVPIPCAWTISGGAGEPAAPAVPKQLFLLHLVMPAHHDVRPSDVTGVLAHEITSPSMMWS